MFILVRIIILLLLPLSRTVMIAGSDDVGFVTIVAFCVGCGAVSVVVGAGGVVGGDVGVVGTDGVGGVVGVGAVVDGGVGVGVGDSETSRLLFSFPVALCTDLSFLLLFSVLFIMEVLISSFWLVVLLFALLLLSFPMPLCMDSSLLLLSSILVFTMEVLDLLFWLEVLVLFAFLLLLSTMLLLLPARFVNLVDLLLGFVCDESIPSLVPTSFSFFPELLFV